MTIPTHQELMLPLLQFAADGQSHHIRDAIEVLSSHLQITPAERAELIPSGRKFKFDDRVQWANTYLKKAGLLQSVGRGLFQITDRGFQVLQENPTYIGREYLLRFPEFREFITPLPAPTAVEHHELATSSAADQTPEELIYAVYNDLRRKLADELLETILSAPPAFFEKLVVDLLLGMGYGGSFGTGKRIGQSGDGGIDGYIDEDKLGLDRIYIQAKRWSPETVVGRPVVQGFVGSLMGARAAKGVFITTSSFSGQAHEYAEGLSNLKVILIDGLKLTQLMIEHNVGVSPGQTYVVKKIDRDYFDIE